MVTRLAILISALMTIFVAVFVVWILQLNARTDTLMNDFPQVKASATAAMTDAQASHAISDKAFEKATKTAERIAVIERDVYHTNQGITELKVLIAQMRQIMLDNAKEK